MAGAGQMMASDLRGSNVYGANNEVVGDIKDILLERDGRVAAIIVGVGGFLGIGEKSVAIPFQAFEYNGAPRDPATTGSVPTSAPRTSMGTVKPERIVLRNMTRADLEAAPAFGRASGAR
jgi:sporulation protein YlmC with PRC-barrel domain